MKKMCIFLCAAATLLLSMAMVEANDFSNGDFESGDIGGWSTWCVTGETSMLENHTPGGKFSAAPTLNDPNGPFNIGALIQEVSGVTAGDQLSASAWIKTEDLKGEYGSEVQAILKVEFCGGGLVIRSEEAGRLSGTNDWQKVIVNTTAPEGTELVKVLLLLWNTNSTGNSGKAYFDDAELVITK